MIAAGFEAREIAQHEIEAISSSSLVEGNQLLLTANVPDRAATERAGIAKASERHIGLSGREVSEAGHGRRPT
jgi:hypothetical protein